MKDIFKSNKFVIFAIVLLIVVSLFAVAFAYFTPLITEGNIFSTTGNAVNNAPDFTFTELTEGGINLTGTYPMTDEVGMTTDPYSFKIKNNETIVSINYEIIMEVKTGNTLSNSLVSTSIGEEIKVLTSNITTSATQTGYNTAYIISSGELRAKEEKTFDLRVWINESGNIENAQNKTWAGKIVVRSVKGILSDAAKTLTHLNATFMMPLQEPPTDFNMFNYTWSGHKAVCNNYDLYNCTYELALTSEQQARAWGIFPIQDDFGTNYYFRGSSLIVKFGTFNKNYYLYPTYYYDDFVGMYNTIGDVTGTLEECQNSLGAEGGQLDCSTLTPIITAGTPMYWQIVRIQSDGSLKLLYKGTSPNATGVQSYLTQKNFAENDLSLSGVYTYNESNIKSYLEEWFDDNLKDEMTHLTTSLYIDEAEGSTYSEGFTRSTFNSPGVTDINVTNSVLRLEKNALGHTTDVSPSLKEPTIAHPSFSYIDDAYIGLLSVDEAVLSGLDGVFGAEYYESYPYTVNTSESYWINGSPGLVGLESSQDYKRYIITPHGSINYQLPTYLEEGNEPAIIPVITLSSNAAQKLQGDGSTIIPYELPD